MGEERKAALLHRNLTGESDRLRGDMQRLEGMRVDLGDRRAVLNRRIERLTQLAARILGKDR